MLRLHTTELLRQMQVHVMFMRRAGPDGQKPEKYCRHPVGRTDDVSAPYGYQRRLSGGSASRSFTPPVKSLSTGRGRIGVTIGSEIDLTTDGLSFYTSGDNIAMTRIGSLWHTWTAVAREAHPIVPFIWRSISSTAPNFNSINHFAFRVQTSLREVLLSP